MHIPVQYRMKIKLRNKDLTDLKLLFIISRIMFSKVLISRIMFSKVLI